MSKEFNELITQQKLIALRAQHGTFSKFLAEMTELEGALPLDTYLSQAKGQSNKATVTNSHTGDFFRKSPASTTSANNNVNTSSENNSSKSGPGRRS